MTIHTIPIPHGLTIDQAWMFHCAGVALDATYGESWANIVVDEDTHTIVSVIPAGRRLEAV